MRRGTRGDVACECGGRSATTRGRYGDRRGIAARVGVAGRRAVSGHRCVVRCSLMVLFHVWRSVDLHAPRCTEHGRAVPASGLPDAASPSALRQWPVNSHAPRVDATGHGHGAWEPRTRKSREPRVPRTGPRTRHAHGRGGGGAGRGGAGGPPRGATPRGALQILVSSVTRPYHGPRAPRSRSTYRHAATPLC